MIILILGKYHAAALADNLARHDALNRGCAQVYEAGVPALR